MMSIELLNPIFSLNFLIPLRSSFLRWFLILRAHGTACQCWALPWLFCRASSLHCLMNHQRWQDGRPSGLCQACLAQQSQQCYTLFRAVGTKGVTKVIHTNTYQFWYPLVPHEEINASTVAFLCRAIYRSTGSSKSSAPKSKTFFPQELQPVTFSGKFCKPKIASNIKY